MPALLVKNLPGELHARLRQSAEAHRRSVTQEAIVLLEKALAANAVPSLRPPPKIAASKKPLTDAWLRKAIKSGRA